VKVSLLRPDPSCKTDCREIKDKDKGTQTYRLFDRVKLESLATRLLQKDDILTFALKNEDTERDYYVYLLDLTPDGSIHAVFPSPEDRQEHARVNAGEERDLSKATGLQLDARGVETLKVIVSRKPIDVRLFEAEGYRGVQKSALNPLERLLVELMDTRGQAISLQEDDWGTVQVEFAVK